MTATRLPASAGAWVLLGAVGLGCSAFTDFGELSGGQGPAGSGDAGDAGAVVDAGGESTLPPPGPSPPAPPGTTGEIVFGGAAAVDVYSAECPCALPVPRTSGSDIALVLALAVNGHDEHLPGAVRFGSIPLGPPIETAHEGFTRLAVWVITNPSPGDAFSVEWENAHLENGVMMLAHYSGVDPSAPVRRSVSRAGSSGPASVELEGGAADEVIVSLFSIHDTDSEVGLVAANIGAGQAFRLQSSNDTDESQLAFSDSPASTWLHRWAYAGPSAWAGVALSLAPAK